MTGVVGAFDSDEHIRVFLEHGRSGMAIHIVGVVFVARAPHARTDDVKKGQHTGLRTIDHSLLEILKASPSGTARIGDCGDSVAKGKAIRVDAVIASVGVFLSCSGVDMHVDVYETGSEIVTMKMDGLDRVGGCDVWRNSGDLSIFEGNIHDAVAVILCIQNMTPGEDEIVLEWARWKWSVPAL